MPVAPPDAVAVAARVRGLQIVALAMTVGVVVYVVVAWLALDLQGAVARRAPPRDSEVLAAGVAGILILISSRLRSRIAAPPGRRRLPFLPAGSAPGAGSRGGPPEELATRFARYRRAVLVSLVLREAVGIIGLAFALWVGDARWAVIFGLASVLALLAAWPRQREFLRLTR